MLTGAFSWQAPASPKMMWAFCWSHQTEASERTNIITPRLNIPWSWLKQEYQYEWNKTLRKILPRVAPEKNSGIYHLPYTFCPGRIKTRGPIIVFCDPLQEGGRRSRGRVYCGPIAAATLYHLHGLVIAVLADQVNVAEDILLSVLVEAVCAVLG